MSIDSQLLNLTGGIKTSGHIKSNFGATIGVGTDAPTGVVEVQHSQPTLVVQQQATSGGSVTSYGKVHAASGTLHIQSGVDATSDSKGDIVLGSVGSGTKHVVVKGATSRVGIGSDAPAYGLDVVPESRFTGNVIASNISTNVLTLNELTLGVTQGLDNVVNVDNTTSNTIAMSNVDESTSTTTGALTVAGGIGVGGNVHCANLYASNITMVRKLELQDGGLGLKRGSNVSVSGTPSAVIQEITGPHARESAVLKKYPEVAFAEGKFETTDNEIVSTYWAGHSTVFQGGYSVKTSHHSTDDGGQYGWHVFDDNPETIWKNVEDYNSSTGNYDYGFTNVQSRLTDTNSTNHDGDHVIMGSPSKLKIVKVSVTCKSSSRRVVNYSVLGSNSTGTTGWTLLDSGSFAAQDANIATITSPTTHFKYHAFVVRSVTAGVNGQRFQINSIHYYGYDEEVGAGDDSVDTTVKSVFNAPDLTSAALYIDAAKTGTSVTDQSGSTPSVTVTATGVTYDSTENAWELTGAATSNIVSGDLASLVGDHPHSVSAWVKADQLNGDGLFHVGTAEGEGDAASRVGFVDDSHISWGGEDHFFSNAEWHNVTYTYNGEGSDKKLYLDGRLVDTAKNEDTFGDYPPFAMTNYSEYGYTVSASSEYNTSDYPAWEAFNKTHAANGDAWLSGNAQNYNGGSGAYSGSANLGSDSGGAAFANADKGEWLKIEMPHKMVLDYIDICGSNSNTVNPKDWKIYGSNDGKNWDVLLSKTNSVTAGYNSATGRTHAVSATRAYKFFALVVTRTNGYTYYTQVSELRLYGHRENDLVRFPDPTNVLKYPHVAMTGPAQRGYVASASSQYHDGNYPHYNAFNNVFTGSDPTHTWNSKASAYHTSSDGEYNGSDNFSTTISGTAYAGEWIQIELPRKVVASALKLGSYGSNSGRSPRVGAFAGSNDGSTWDLLKTYSGETSWTQGTLKSFAPSNNTTTAYKYFRFVITRVQATNDGLTALQAFEVHGTESGDVVARVGDGFDGKVRNLRVYSTALSDARVQEIFDADKDEFELAKSSVSVYRGRLGVGTAEAKGALTVMDEVAELGEFPPRGFSVVGVPATTLSLEQYIEGHGVFRVSTSSNHGSAGSIPGAFDKQTNTYWHAAGAAYSGTDYSYPSSGTSSLAEIRGDWLRLELPYKVKLSSIGIRARIGFGNGSTGDQSPEDFTILGNNDNGIWTVIQSFTGKSWSDIRSTTIPITTGPEAYNSFAIVITKVANSTGLTIAELRYFGTREQGASTLHNGELSLTRNLTVPRIGPPLDADDTPRRDRLVVEYNTSTNPVENGVVKDTSGRGLDGLTYNGASYSDKALVFDGTNDYVFQNDVGLTSVFSISFWVKLKSKAAALAGIGTYASNQTCTFYISSTQFQVIGYNNDNYWAYDFPLNTWVHACVTYNGGGFTTLGNTRLYINGVEASGTKTTYLGGGATTSTTITFPSSCNLYMGRMQGGSPNYASCSESNLKLYDVALTADEVKRLYDMGRCDEGHHVVNFDKTRVGIGLGDGEAPQSTLDVRGTFQGNSPLHFYVLHGVHPNPLANQSAPFREPGVINGTSKIVSVSGVTHNSNDDVVPWEYHSESAAWEVQTYYDISAQDFVIFSQGTSTAGKKWSMYIVTT